MTPKNIPDGGAHRESPHKKLIPLRTVQVPQNFSDAVIRCKQNLVAKHVPEHARANEQVRPRPANKIRADLRDDAQEQPKFLAALNLLPKKKALEIQNSRKIFPSLKRRLRARKDTIVSYFRSKPVPLSSAVGQTIVQNSAFGKCGNPELTVRNYEKNCKTIRHTKRASPNATTQEKPWPQVNVRRLKQVATAAGNHVHQYSRGKNQRINRLAEIVVGLNKKSFHALNQCQGFDIRVHRMTDEEIAFKIAEIEGIPHGFPEQRSSSTNSEVTRWISSQPVAGTSSGIETLATPVIKLWDFMLEAPLVKKSSVSKKTLKEQR